MSTVPATTPIGRLAELGTSAWLDSIGRSMLTAGSCERLVRRGRRGRRHVEPVDLRAGDPRQPRLRRAARRADERRRRRARRSTGRSRSPTSRAPPTCCALCGSAPAASTATSRSRSRRRSRATPTARSRGARLWARVDRPNVMIKIPGTPEGVAGDPRRDRRRDQRQRDAAVLARGVGGDRRGVAGGLEDRAGGGQAGRRHRLGRLVLRLARRHRRRQAPEGARQQPSCAARPRSRTRSSRTSAGSSSSAASASPRCSAQGARPQRPLWASTGTKDPRYPDVKYVDELAGPETVNTMPLATLLAYQDHGSRSRRSCRTPRPPRTRRSPPSRPPGLDSTRSPTSCSRPGSSPFADAMDTLLAGIERRRAAVLAGEPASIEARLTDAQARAIGARAAWAQRAARAAARVGEGRRAVGAEGTTSRPSGWAG